ncbi:unnamed protein product [Allacma fusca]|uniref:Uncharacterized protein n=1 Tax=Allacma fusca TaxID=39272 RepID=A0A8J2PZU7_9HEXA|nr:unnamed protein product [Allacma fusca]
MYIITYFTCTKIPSAFCWCFKIGNGGGGPLLVIAAIRSDYEGGLYLCEFFAPEGFPSRHDSFPTYINPCSWKNLND